MKKNNAALWGTVLIGAIICIIVDVNFSNVNHSAIGILGMAGVVTALAGSYLFFRDIVLMIDGKTGEKTQEELEQERQEKEKRASEEKERQEILEKKLDELILVEKAVYTMLRKEAEDREAAYEEMEAQLKETAKELLSNQEKAVKVMIKYNRDDRQNVSEEMRGEIVKVQRVTAVAQKHLISAAEELNTSILENTKALSDKLTSLEGSLKNMSVSVTAVQNPAEDMPASNMSAPDIEIPVENIVDSIATGLEEEAPESVVAEEDIFAAMENEVEEAASIPESASTPESVPEPEPIPVAAPVTDDPNRMMSPDEIAALIASVGGGDSTSEEKEPEPEPIPEPTPEPEPTPVAAPVADNPNRMMSPDEIAALIASVGGGDSASEEKEPEPEPIAEPTPEPEPMPVEAPVTDDPNRAMTPDEIAALFASMGGDATVEKVSEPEPAPEPIAEEPKSAPAAPVIDDPNRAMTPDEIAALIASMN